MAALTFTKGPQLGQTVLLEGERNVLGRDAECQVVINVPAVSRKHAVVTRIQGKHYIEDLKSRNGTFVNNQEVTTKILLKDNDKIKICDNVLVFSDDSTKGSAPAIEEEEEASSTVEASISHSSKQILEAQPAEKLTLLIDLGAELTQTLDLEILFPKILDHLFRVFRQADRGFVILQDEGKLIPKVIKTRRIGEETQARFSRRIVHQCLQTGEGLLSEDASKDKRFDMSQSIVMGQIRSVMCAPLVGRSSGQTFGVLQLDTQDRSKKFTADDLKLLLAVAGQGAVALENAQMHSKLMEQARLEHDLKVATNVQHSFLPKKLPQIPGYEFYACYEPALEVGGDYYDFIPLGEGRWAIMLGDVAGKGMGAALLMAKVSSDARFCMLAEKDPAQAVSRLNQLLLEANLQDRFVTLVAGLLDPQSHGVTFVNAGHQAPLLFRKNTSQLVEAMPRELSGFALGLGNEPFPAVSLQLDPGDGVILFTDGVTDARNKADEEFGMARIQAVLQVGPMTAPAMGQRLLAAIRQHSFGRNPHDDITLVCFGRNE